jgi:hypothetical protein
MRGDARPGTTSGGAIETARASGWAAAPGPAARRCPPGDWWASAPRGAARRGGAGGWIRRASLRTSGAGTGTGDEPPGAPRANGAHRRRGSGGKATTRQGCAPAGPRPWRRGSFRRRGLGCVGHGGIVPYAARSPAPAQRGRRPTRRQSVPVPSIPTHPSRRRRPVESGEDRVIPEGCRGRGFRSFGRRHALSQRMVERSGDAQDDVFLLSIRTTGLRRIRDQRRPWTNPPSTWMVVPVM